MIYDEHCENMKEIFRTLAICENRVSAFFVMDNRRPISGNSLTYEDVNEEDCINMCSENRDNKGRSILCASFTYDHAFFTCTIYRSKSSPDGDLETEAAVGKRFFEKFCIDEELPVECADSQFLRADQSVIIGYAKNVSIVESLEECATQCLKERFPCKSAMYFYEEGECITNTESALTKPSSFAREESDRVIYFHSGCNIVLERQKLLDAATETETTTESSEATTLPQETTTDAVGSVTLEADRVISDGDSHQNGEEGTPAITSKVDEDAVDKNDKKQNRDVEKLNEKEISREKVKKLRERKVKMNGGEKRPLRLQAGSDISEVAALDEVEIDSEEEEKEERKKELKVKKGSKDNAGKKVHEAMGKKRNNEEDKQASGKMKAKSSSKGGGCRQDDESPNEDESETKQTKAYNNHPRALSTTDDEHKKVDPAVLLAEQHREEVGASEVTIKKKAKARGVAQKSSRKLKIKSLAQVDEEFASGQPCKNHEVIGFESRECIAKDPTRCIGPFFRYCTLPC
uniref:Apple domain-containing protein n=1 Tax=Parascaris univalens TaxID=6257 RepID=A0A915BBB7_PARUN